MVAVLVCLAVVLVVAPQYQTKVITGAWRRRPGSRPFRACVKTLFSENP
jgi:hypothetical protein